MFNHLRKDFPILHKQLNGKQLIYLDTAATSQKPQAVLDALHHFYTTYNANIHRSVHTFGEHATQLYEQARITCAQFIKAHPEEIIFTSGTTEGINFIASIWADEHISEHDEIIITELEHHANLLPWQNLAHKKRAKLLYIPVHQDGTLQLNKLEQIITKKTKLIAVSSTSNVLGVHNDIETIITVARSNGIRILIDAAQAVAHHTIDVKKLDVDFLAFSGHKILGPTGIGVLYIKKQLHDETPPYQFGGGMVFHAGLQESTWRSAPQKFEAGTPPIAQAIGLAAALDYMKKNIDFETLQQYEASLCARLIDGLQTIKGVTLYGPIEQIKKQGHIVTFSLQNMHAHDVATYLNSYGICVRAGNQCAQPLAQALGIESSVRASVYFYNTPQEIDACIQAVAAISSMRF